MKTIKEFLFDLYSQDIKLWVEGDRLRCNAPKEKLTPALKAELGTRKAEILAFLYKTNTLNYTQKTIQPVPRNGNLPLSFAQQRLWFIDQLAPSSSLYNLPTALHLKGILNVTALTQTLNEILRRHEILRTSFISVEGQPVQVITPTLTITLPIVDLQELAEVEQENEIQQIITNEALRPFNLSQAPLLRATLLRLSEVEHIVMCTMHHIVSDAWSMGVLIQEVAALYESFSKGQPSPLPELSIQYVDFAVWQQQWLFEVLEAQLKYWRSQLGGNLPVLKLPTDRPRPRVQTFQGATKSFKVSKNLTQALKALSRNEDVTLFMTLLAAFKTLLYRYTAQDDILVGSPIANRNRDNIEQLIGFFVNTLVLRTNLSGNPSFRELLGRVREVTLGAYTHQDMPFEQLVEELQPQRDLSHPPLFQVMFAFQNAPMSALELSGLTVSSLESNKDTAKFDLTLYIEETTQGIVGTLEYNTDLFEASTICRMIGHLQTLLAGIVANPDQQLMQLPLLTEIEQHQILIEWNNHIAAYRQDVCIHHLFEEQVEKSPSAIAVVFEDQQLTYRELNQQANQLAHYLQNLGVRPEVLVGICMERSLEMIIGILGVLKAGGAYVPLDPDYPQERLAFMLADTQISVLLTQQYLGNIGHLPPHQAPVICLDTDREALSQQPLSNPVSTVTTSNSAYVIYTSGSTGRPKGVVNTHTGICNRLLWMQDNYQLTREDKVLQKTPFSFDVSVWEFFLPLLNGSRLVIARPGGHQDSAYLLQLIIKEQITILHFVPSMLQVFLEEPELEKCKSLKYVICSGEALPFELQKRFLQGSSAELHNLYGPTEAAIDVTFWNCRHHHNLEIVPIGRPIANTQIYLLDWRGQPVPIGIPGELHIGGIGLARSYLNRSELTAEKFIPNPFWHKPGERLYKTGDLARYRPGGEIEFLGRIDHQVKLRGFRIELGEIEAVLNQHPKVRQSVLVALEDKQGNKQLVAYVSPQLQQIINTSELRCFLKEKLPEYMVPSALVVLSELPLTSSSKVNRQALPIPNQAHTELKSTFEPPRTAVENILVGIWAKLLQVEKIGIYDNFFELGGHSLLATQVVSKVRQIFQVELPLQTLFEAPTIAGFALHIQSVHSQGSLLWAPIKKASRELDLPLSFAQQRLWFLEQVNPNTSTYNTYAGIRIQGLLNVAALEQSLNEIIRRHEVLRTTFEVVNGYPVQVIAPNKTLKAPVVDLSKLPDTERQQKTQEITDCEVQTPFDLSHPLLRVTLLQLGKADYVLLVVMHHIISDGWSMGVIVQELAALYEAFCLGKSSPLPELTIQYADFAVWQRQWLQGEVLETQLAYWKQQLSANLPLLKLPTDHPRPVVPNYQAGRQFLALPNLSKMLKKFSNEEGVTLFMTLLAAFITLLHYYTEQDDIVVGTDVANRNQGETEQLIGFFVNQLVLRTYLGGNPSFRELLKRVREVTLGAYAHQDLPFDKLVEVLNPERKLNHTPLFQVKIILQNAPVQSLEMSGLTLTPWEFENTTVTHDLLLELKDTESGITGLLKYNTDLFEAKSIARMLRHFEVILCKITTDPSLKLSDIKETLSQADKKELFSQEQNYQKTLLNNLTSIKRKSVSR